MTAGEIRLDLLLERQQTVFNTDELRVQSRRQNGSFMGHTSHEKRTSSKWTAPRRPRETLLEPCT